MKGKFIEGGIYNLKLYNLDDFEYCVVLKEKYDFLIVHCLEDYIDMEKAPVNKQVEIIECIKHGLNFMMNDIRFKHDSFNIVEPSKIEVGGYIGKVDEEMLEKLSELAKPQYKMIFE